MPNNFAYIALILWPFISLLFYRHMPIVQATFWTIVGGFLVLPVKTVIDFPFIPPLDKELIPVIAALIGCRYIKKIKIKLVPKEGVERWLVLLFIISPIFTTLNNQEPFNGIPGLTLHDTISAIIHQYLFIFPFILGMQIIKTYDDQLLLFKLLVVAGLIYSVPILFEVRMSPQLHTWVYGFFPHSFFQQVRYDGFRSVVFLGHGLIVSMFIAVSLGAASILLKEKIKLKIIPPWFIVLYLILLLYLNKTIGSFLLGIFVFIAITRLSIHTIRRISLIIIFIALLYPLLSLMDLFPHQQMIQIATDFDPARGESLAYRFRNEAILLDHAKDKILFGWGGWNRNRLEGTVTDGYWIILLGQYGIAGFVSLFGLAVLSVWRAIKTVRHLKDKVEIRIVAYHGLLVSVIMIDQLPNASIAAWLIFIIGALLGRSNYIKRNHLLNGNSSAS